jgi:hypothetical protein
VTGVAFLVEIGMGQFGNPDLILVCRSAPGCLPHVVFLEAKVVPYLESAMSNPSTLAARGYNSSINGQLVLRHRLAQTLCGWRADNSLSEPIGLHAAYRRPPGRQGGLGDPLPRPRRLLKPAVLGLIREHGLDGLPPDHYHLVAWTWDRGPFFAPDAAVPDDLMPVLLTPGGEDAWDETRGRIGWLGFEQVRDSVSPGEGYTRAVATMLPTLVPSVTTTTAETGEPLITENFARFSEATVRLAGEIEELARLSFGERSVERGSGSSSVTIAGQVRLKVIPSDPGGEEHVVLGIRATLSPQDWCPHRLAGPRLTLGGTTGA